MNALQISNALKRDPIVKEKFVSVFSSNTDASGQPGMHWVAFVTNNPGEIEAFDSFGRNPGVYSDHLPQWINYEFLVMSNIQRQSTDATTCGQYCMSFVLLRCYGFSYKDVQSALVENKTVINKFVCKFVNRYFGLSTSTHDRKFLLEALRR